MLDAECDPHQLMTLPSGAASGSLAVYRARGGQASVAGTGIIPRVIYFVVRPPRSCCRTPSGRTIPAGHAPPAAPC